MSLTPIKIVLRGRIFSNSNSPPLDYLLDGPPHPQSGCNDMVLMFYLHFKAIHRVVCMNCLLSRPLIAELAQRPLGAVDANSDDVTHWRKNFEYSLASPDWVGLPPCNWVCLRNNVFLLSPTYFGLFYEGLFHVPRCFKDSVCCSDWFGAMHFYISWTSPYVKVCSGFLFLPISLFIPLQYGRTSFSQKWEYAGSYCWARFASILQLWGAAGGPFTNVAVIPKDALRVGLLRAHRLSRPSVCGSPDLALRASRFPEPLIMSKLVRFLCLTFWSFTPL